MVHDDDNESRDGDSNRSSVMGAEGRDFEDLY
jgi:hypothetical protein